MTNLFIFWEPTKDEKRASTGWMGKMSVGEGSSGTSHAYTSISSSVAPKLNIKFQALPSQSLSRPLLI